MYVSVCVCARLLSAGGSSSCQLTSCIWRDQRLRVRSKMEHSMGSLCGREYLPHTQLPLFHTFCPPPSLWRVHQFVSQQILLFTDTQQQDPWLKLSEQEQRQGVGKEGGSGAAAVFTSGFSCAAALSIDHHSVTV